MCRLIKILLGLTLLTACAPAVVPAGTIQPEITSSISKKEPTPQPTLSLNETSAKEFKIKEFSDAHSSVNNDPNEFLIFGNLPVMEKTAVSSPDLAVFLGRWEGYSLFPPIKKDRKLVLHFADISEQGGRLYGWIGTNIQYPEMISEAHFRVADGETPKVEFKMKWLDGSTLVNSFWYDRENDILRGEAKRANSGEQTDIFELTRDKTFFVYKDYVQYLAGKNITVHEYKNPDLKQYGKGYMLYLPEGYEAEKQKSWPLIYFLHGSGDCGDNLLVLAKASPFMFIREKGPLQAIIVAPLLANTSDFALFPEEYMDGALEEFLTTYRVDASRIYLTGLSLGGEAVYRFVLHQPDVFAAVSPLCAFTLGSNASAMQKIKNIPVWAIHGAEDTIVTPDRGQKPVDELKQAGGNVKFSLLPGHDHDVWTDTYSDPTFFEWLLTQRKK